MFQMLHETSWIVFTSLVGINKSWYGYDNVSNVDRRIKNNV